MNIAKSSGAFVLFLICCAGCISSSHAGVTLLSEGIGVQADMNLDEGGNSQDGTGSGDFDSFIESVSVTSASRSAAGSVECTDLSDQGRLAYTGTGQFTSSASGDSGLSSQTLLTFAVQFDVTGAPVPYELTLNASPSFSGAVGSSTVSVQFADASDVQDCSAASGCGDLSIDRKGELEPGAYTLFMQIKTRAFSAGSGQATLTASWSLSVGSCLLTWTDPAGGDFADPENWSPAQAPVNSGDGCVNLVLDEPGAYAITLPGDATANSLTVAAGEPSLLGGALFLGGVDIPDALSVVHAARLTLESGRVTSGSFGSGSVLVSGAGAGKGEAQPAFLRLKPGAILDAFENLEVGRGIGEAGELVLGDGVEKTEFSMLGDVTLGGAGKSTVFGNGNLDFGVVGDLLMGVFDGSQSNLNLNGDAAQLRAVEFSVGGASIIGGQGSAALSLSGLSVGTMDSLRMGTIAGGEGTLNLSGADCQLDITKDATVGEAGQADIVVLDGARLKAAGLLLGTEAGGRGGIELTGEGSTIELSGDATIGGEGSAGAEVSNGGTLKAGFITVDSTGESGALLSVKGATAPAKAEASTGMIVAGSGNGGLALSGQASITTPTLAMGVLAGSDSLSIWQGPEAGGIDDPTMSIEVTDNAQIGLDGTAEVSSFGTSNHKFRELWLGVNLNGTGDLFTSGASAFTTVTGDLLVGVQGKGTLQIDEGRLTAGACTLGAEIGGLGVVRLTGGANLLVGAQPVSGKGAEAPGFLQVGAKSNGLLELFDANSRVECAEAIIGGDNPAAGGTVNIDTGAQFECFGSVTLGAAEGPALVRVADRASMTIGSILSIGPKALFIAGGGANVNAGFVSIEGRFKIVDGLSIERPADKGGFTGHPKGNGTGNGPAVIEGDLELGPDGVLEVTAGAGEALIVTGAATLDGTLEITLQPGATFTDGQFLDLIDFQGGSTGDFASVTFLNAPEGFEGDVEFTDGKLRLRVITGGTVDPEGEGEGQTNAIHSADTDSNGRISLSELLRVIQIYNALGLHCSPGESEDGYIPGTDDTAEQCAPHDSDFNPQDWTIILGELLQLIQLYNADGYEACVEPEAFCPLV